MSFALSWTTALALFGAMVVLAALPSLSVLVVVSRASSLGFRHVVAAALGIVLGDLVLMAIALLGLAAVSEALGSWYRWLNLAAAAYLLWTGVTLWRARPSVAEQTVATNSSLAASLAAGWLLTLGDQKAVLFYLAFFPAFLDLQALTVVDAGAIALITFVAVGGTKCVYAALADRVRARLEPGFGQVLNRIAGTLLVLAGVAVAWRGWSA